MWVDTISAAVGLLALLYIPGYFVLRGFWFDSRQALVAAPVTSAAMIALLGIVWKAVHIPWRPWTVLPVFAVLAACSLWVIFRRGRSAEAWIARPEKSLIVWVGIPVLMVLSSLAIVGAMGRINPSLPLQGWDPVFHANGVALVKATKEASYFGSLTGLYGLDTTTTNYTVGWHAIASLVAAPSTVIQTMNAFIAVTAVVWLTSMWGLIRGLGYSNRHVAAYLVLAPAMIVFPTYMLTVYAPLPNSFAQALLPSLLAIMAIAVREVVRDRSSKIFLARFAVIAVVIVGALFIHPAFVTSMLVLLLPPIASIIFRQRKTFSKRTRITFWVGVGSTLAIVVGALVFVPSFANRLAAQLTYTTTPSIITFRTFLKTFTAWPMLDASAGPFIVHTVRSLQVLLGILLVLGMGRLIYKRRGRWLIVAWFLTAALTFTALVRQGPLVAIAGLWYMSPHRTMALQQIPMSVIVAIGLVTLIDLLVGLLARYVGKKRSTPLRILDTVGIYRRTLLSVMVITLVATTALSWSARAELVARGWGLKDPTTAMVTQEEADMLYRLRDKLPADALVLGDPANGSALALAMSGHRVVFAQIYIRDSNKDGWYLAKHFRYWQTDPDVCRIVNKLGVTHYYADGNDMNLGRSSLLRTPGLYGVDTAEGFEEVDAGGRAAVYKITGCEKAGQ